MFSRVGDLCQVFRRNFLAELRYYSSHGDAISVEEVDGVPYIWASTFGSKSSDGTYANSQMFCRIRFEAGKEYTPEQIAESEGIQFRDGVMYSGWLSWDATGCFDAIMKF